MYIYTTIIHWHIWKYIGYIGDTPESQHAQEYYEPVVGQFGTVYIIIIILMTLLRHVRICAT
jgi:hypothetical protein